MTRETGTWLITWDDREWGEDDLTGAHAALITLLSGKDDWGQLDPLKGPMVLMQMLAAFVSHADRRPPLDVIADLGRTSLKQLLAAVSLVE